MELLVLCTFMVIIGFLYAKSQHDARTRRRVRAQHQQIQSLQTPTWVHVEVEHRTSHPETDAVCGSCGTLFPSSLGKCPNCGHPKGA